MQIRHKQNHEAQYECVGEGRTFGGEMDYLCILPFPTGGMGFFPKAHFEPVPVKSWESCSYFLSQGGQVLHLFERPKSDDSLVPSPSVSLPNGYRFVKSRMVRHQEVIAELCRLKGLQIAIDYADINEYVCEALLVERQR
jgi:hypothetical protein